MINLTHDNCVSLLGQCDNVIEMARAQLTWIGSLLCIFYDGLNASGQFRINLVTHKQSYWACTYGFSMADVDL